MIRKYRSFLSIFTMMLAIAAIFQNCSSGGSLSAAAGPSITGSSQLVFGLYDITTISRVEFRQTSGDTFVGARIPQVDIWLNQSNSTILSAIITNNFAGQSNSCTVAMPVAANDFASIFVSLLGAQLSLLTPAQPSMTAGAPDYYLDILMSDSSEHTYRFANNPNDQGLLIVDSGSGLQSLLQSLANRASCN